MMPIHVLDRLRSGKKTAHGLATVRGHGSRNYQIFTCLSPLRTMASPALQSNALANSGMFDGAPTARNFAGECGSEFRRTICSFSRVVPRQTRAQLRKKRWSSV